jgi:hypothetical protein
MKRAVTGLITKKTPVKSHTASVTPKKPQLKMAAYQNYLAKFGRNQPQRATRATPSKESAKKKAPSQMEKKLSEAAKRRKTN